MSSLALPGGVCFPHLPAEAVLSSSTCLGGSDDVFQPGTAEDPTRDRLESELPGEAGERAGCGGEGKQVSGSLPPGYGPREEP